MYESVSNRVRVIEMGGITVLSKVRIVPVLVCESQQTCYNTVVLMSNVFLDVVLLLLLFTVAGGRGFVFFA